MGATLGGSLGSLVQLMWPGLGVNPVMMAVIGMAAVVGSGTGAAMTAILMIFEMTRDYAAVVPSIVAVAMALGVRRTLSYENIYTIKLAWRGHHIPRERHSHMFMIRHASDIMKPVHGMVTAEELTEATRKAAGGEDGYLIVRKGGIIEGLVRVGGTVDVGEEVLTRNFVIARSDSFIRDVMARMSHSPLGARLGNRGRPQGCAAARGRARHRHPQQHRRDHHQRSEQVAVFRSRRSPALTGPAGASCSRCPSPSGRSARWRRCSANSVERWPIEMIAAFGSRACSR